MRLLNRVLCATVLGLTSVASAVLSGVALPGGGWAGWRCLTPEDGLYCRVPVFVRLSASGQVQSRQQVPESRAPGPVLLHPNGRTLYLGGSTLVALDAATLRAHWHVPGPPVGWGQEPLALSPNGRQLAVSGPNGTVHLLDTRTGRLIRTLHHPFFKDQQDGYGDFFAAPTALAFSPDGHTLAIGSRGGGVRVRSLATGRERHLVGGCGAGRPVAHRGPVRGLLFTGTDALVSAANDEQLIHWSLQRPPRARCLSIPGGVTALHPLPQGRLLALGVTSGTLLNRPEVTRLARLAPFSSELVRWQVTGETLSLSDGLSTRRWNVLSGEPLTSTAAPLATFPLVGALVTIGDDLRVRVRANGQVQDLWPPVIAPANLDGAGSPAGWQVERTGDRLTVKATSNIRVMTMDTANFTNEYGWAWPSGRFLGCRTVLENGRSDKPDRACTSALKQVREP